MPWLDSSFETYVLVLSAAANPIDLRISSLSFLPFISPEAVYCAILAWREMKSCMLRVVIYILVRTAGLIKSSKDIDLQLLEVVVNTLRHLTIIRLVGVLFNVPSILSTGNRFGSQDRWININSLCKAPKFRTMSFA